MDHKLILENSSSAVLINTLPNAIIYLSTWVPMILLLSCSLFRPQSIRISDLKLKIRVWKIEDQIMTVRIKATVLEIKNTVAVVVFLKDTGLCRRNDFYTEKSIPCTNFCVCVMFVCMLHAWSYLCCKTCIKTCFAGKILLVKSENNEPSKSRIKKHFSTAFNILIHIFKQFYNKESRCLLFC